ncbi:MAG: DUF924 domain-containing protein [Chromatiaceae bacterium]|nr:DUF924 domain-containing protein [Chromatiaceae bacterium]MBP8289533.1 DUF924 domain-containing protein [Chromatiaceae bacterium]
MTATTTAALPSDVVTFWFSASVRPLWFAATAAFDQALRGRFLTTYRAAAAGERADWEITPEGALALVIVLDQFPLNMFRGRPEAFATEAAARGVAERAIARGLDQALSSEQQVFLFMPFMHSEALADQERSVHLFQQPGLEQSLGFARHHRGLIQRFGRFPHRNAILGRANTAEEVAYLASPEAFHG